MSESLEIGEGTLLAGRYELIERLGSGGMATVYLAEDQVLGRHVAVKRLRREYDPDEATGPLMKRFRREARLGATLSHPNVVTVFDTVTGSDGVLIVMEYVEGETLADEIERGPLEHERALDILYAVAAALDHAHDNGIVHRDVKPANVLLGDDGSVKLADLGIATAAEATRITTANDIVGTLAYVAPERLDADDPGGPEADVYGLAVLAYESLSGEAVNRGSTPAEVVHRAATSAPPDIRDAWPEAPGALAETLQAGLARNPSERPRSAGELVDRITDALDADQPGAVPRDPLPLPPRPPSMVIHRTEDSARRPPRALLIVIAGLALAGLIVFAINLFTGEDEPNTTQPAQNAERAGADTATRTRASRRKRRTGAPAPTPSNEPSPQEPIPPPSTTRASP